MFDLLIKHGKIFDGTGAPPVEGDLGIRAGRIAGLGDLKGEPARRVIDARNLWVAPGFIDVQNHSDSYWTVFDYPHQESMLAQGITTIVLGHCGASLAPLPSLEALKSVQKWHSLEGVNFNWQYFEEFLQVLAQQPLGVNVLSLAGHATMRRGLLGNAVRKLTDPELQVMQRLMLASLKNGAFGLSIGLVYAHEFNTSLKELFALAELVREHDRLLSVHLRSEGSHVVDALGEIVHLVELTGVRTKISHLKVSGHGNWHRFDQLLELLERVYRRRLPISFDVYPYTTTWSVLYTYLPKWAFEGGRVELRKRLQQPYMRRKIVDSLHQQARSLSGIMVATASSLPHLVGKTLGAIAADQGVAVEEALVNVLASTESEVVVFEDTVSAEHLTALLAHPLGMVSTDGAGFDRAVGMASMNLVHPRCFGAMARFLEMSLHQKLMSPEKAIQKITGSPAALLRLSDRGTLKKNARADVTILDPKKIRDLASIENPYQFPSGIRWVLVGGTVSVADGALSGKYAGQVVRA